MNVSALLSLIVPLLVIVPLTVNVWPFRLIIPPVLMVRLVMLLVASTMGSLVTSAITTLSVAPGTVPVLQFVPVPQSVDVVPVQVNVWAGALSVGVPAVDCHVVVKFHEGVPV